MRNGLALERSELLPLLDLLGGGDGARRLALQPGRLRHGELETAPELVEEGPVPAGEGAGAPQELGLPKKDVEAVPMVQVRQEGTSAGEPTGRTVPCSLIYGSIVETGHNPWVWDESRDPSAAGAFASPMLY